MSGQCVNEIQHLTVHLHLQLSKNVAVSVQQNKRADNILWITMNTLFLHDPNKSAIIST